MNLSPDEKLALEAMWLTAQMRREELEEKGRMYEDMQSFINANMGYYDMEFISNEELLLLIKVGVAVCEILDNIGIEAERFNRLSVNQVMELEKAMEVLR